jgi:hypothetical protein
MAEIREPRAFPAQTTKGELLMPKLKGIEMTPATIHRRAMSRISIII